MMPPMTFWPSAAGVLAGDRLDHDVVGEPHVALTVGVEREMLREIRARPDHVAEAPVVDVHRQVLVDRLEDDQDFRRRVEVEQLVRVGHARQHVKLVRLRVDRQRRLCDADAAAQHRLDVLAVVQLLAALDHLRPQDGLLVQQQLALDERAEIDRQLDVPNRPGLGQLSAQPADGLLQVGQPLVVVFDPAGDAPDVLSRPPHLLEDEEGATDRVVIELQGCVRHLRAPGTASPAPQSTRRRPPRRFGRSSRL